MSKELFVTSTPHETKLAVVEDDQVVEIYFERENEYTLAGSIYKGKVTRVLPGMQSAFVDIGLERDAFLYVTDFVEGVEEDHDDEEIVAKPSGQTQPRDGGQREGGRREDRRRGGRGGDNQHRRREDRQPRSEAAEPQGQPIEFGGDFTGEEIDANEQTDLAVSNALTHSDENGEVDSQAAEGGEPATRRWRGRRGRRRRGGDRGQQPEQANAPQAAADENEIEESTAVEDLTEEPAGISAEAVTPQEERPEQSFPAREERPRERPQRQERHERHDRPERPAPTKTLLPGESLKKYGGGGAGESKPGKQQSAANINTVAPRPSTLVNDPSAFMLAGGVLAGESLQKYRERPAQESKPQESKPEVRQPKRRVERESAEAVLPEAAVEAVAPEHSAEPVTEEVPTFQEREPRTEPRAEHSLEREAVPAPPVIVERFPEPVGESEEERGSGPYNFSPGAGEVEEEEIEDEEQEYGHFEMVEEPEYEDLEEETLDPEEEPSREDEMIAAGDKIAAAFAEAKRAEQESTEFVEEDEDDEEGSEDGEEEEEVADDAVEYAAAEEEVDTEDPDYEARAEVRGAAGTAGFQQKTERTERGERGERSERGRRGGRRGRVGRRPMRSRRNIPRGPLPQINELLKEGQEILVQIAKEPMAKKGARITSHIALPGRFLVFMPTVNHTGVSRKIGSDEERRRLKQILLSEKGDAHGGFIVRTAAAGASEEELRSDIRFLINLWNEIKGRSESSKAPALIYHDLNLVERIMRDQVTATFGSIWVDTEAEYERILRFAQRFQPSLIKRVKLYSKDTPLFEQFGVQEEINKALKSKVWLKSGGYIVINQTEALVAIDINTGKFVGKTSRLEDTIVKTNIDAIQEIVRQIRLRDLGGIIIIDFIDMDERRNRQKVMQALEDALRTDRSPTKVLQFNDFGLVAITRKRVKQSLERTLSTQCGYCTGTGMVKSVATICNEIYVEFRKMHKQLEGHQVMLRVNPEVAKALKENSGRWLTEMEELIGKTIIVKSDPAQHQEQFEIH
jgi:ribonuclease G